MLTYNDFFILTGKGLCDFTKKLYKALCCYLGLTRLSVDNFRHT